MDRHNQKHTKETFLAIDCEFNSDGTVREMALLLFQNNSLVRGLEVFISKSGQSSCKYSTSQFNYHINNPKCLNELIEEFFSACTQYADLENVHLVGVSLLSDIQSISKTTGQHSLFSAFTSMTDLEKCGRGTLQDKIFDYNVSSKTRNDFLHKLIGARNGSRYYFHTALYDAVCTAYVYRRLVSPGALLNVDETLQACSHVFFKEYRKDIADTKRERYNSGASNKPQETGVIKNFPNINYKVQKGISNVFDIVPRELFYREYSKFNHEPSAEEITDIKIKIANHCNQIRKKLKAYDKGKFRTNPYNIALVEAGIYLAESKISIETFIDFAIYIQQYNLPENRGKYYKVSNSSKELYVRCFSEITARKMFTKRPFCTIEQFLAKKPPRCKVEIIRFKKTGAAATIH